MQQLEDEIGVDLLRRGPRGVSLTAEGKLFLEEARELLKRADESVERVRALASRRIWGAAGWLFGGTMLIGNPVGGPGGGAVTLSGARIEGAGSIAVNPNGALTGTGTIDLCGACRVDAAE